MTRAQKKALTKKRRELTKHGFQGTAYEEYTHFAKKYGIPADQWASPSDIVTAMENRHVIATSKKYPKPHRELTPRQIALEQAYGGGEWSKHELRNLYEGYTYNRNISKKKLTFNQFLKQELYREEDEARFKWNTKYATERQKLIHKLEKEKKVEYNNETRDLFQEELRKAGLDSYTIRDNFRRAFLGAYYPEDN